MTNPFFKSEQITIAAGNSRTVQRVANFITCLEASADFRIQIDNSPETDFQKGLTFNSDQAFGEVRIVNNGAEELTLTMGFGRGGIRDGRLILAGSSLETTEPRTTWQVPASPDIQQPYNNVSLPTGHTKILASENPNRIKLCILNYSGGGSLNVRLSSDNSMAYPSFILTPYSHVIIEGINEVAGIVGSGTAVATVAELVYV